LIPLAKNVLLRTNSTKELEILVGGLGMFMVSIKLQILYSYSTMYMYSPDYIITHPAD